MIEHVAVVIPARDEGDRLALCLRAVRRAVRHAQQAVPLHVRVVVLLDSCTDESAQIVARYREVTSVHAFFSNVGAARAAGVRWALDALRGDEENTWIATTDADSTVPVDWLTQHLAVANGGADVGLGAVVPVRSELTPAQRAAWDQTHPLGAAAGHVHGANLGVRASAYLAVGGFEPVAVHEDVRLVEALRDRGARVESLVGTPVVTSGRARGRAPHGYTTYLSGLADAAAG